MPNPKGNLATLKQYKPKWNTGKTQTIRVPIALAEELLKIAHELDNDTLTQVNQVHIIKPSASVAEDQESNLQETLTQVIKALEQVCETPHTSKFTKVLKTKLEKEVIIQLKTLIQVNK